MVNRIDIINQLGGGPQFLTFYERPGHARLLGDPVSGIRLDFPAPQAQAFTYGIVGWYPHKPEPYQLELLLLGAEVYTGIPDPKQVAHPIVATYLAQETARGVDTLFWFGRIISPPICSGGECSQFSERAQFVWREGASDPAEVRREPLGERFAKEGLRFRER